MGKLPATARPERVICIILQAFKIGGGNKRKQSHLGVIGTSVKAKHAPPTPLCNASCVIKAMLQFQQSVGCTVPFQGRGKAESSTESECACFWKRDDAEWEAGMPAGLGRSPTPLQLRKRNVHVCPSNCCGSKEAEEFSSRAQDRRQRAAGFKRGIRVVEGIVSQEGNVQRWECPFGSIFFGT